MKLCSVEDCTRDAAAREMCQAHYKRFVRKGTTDPDPRIGAWKTWAQRMLESGSVDECWDWPFGTNGVGYGLCRSEGRDRMATHVLWETHRGERAPSGLFACHTCDRPICVNPHHIFFATQLENIHDAIAKGRLARGSTNGRSKLTEDAVRAIRSASPTVTNTELAIFYGVDASAVSLARRGRTWQHVGAA